MERDKAELERRLALAVEELWCDDKDFRKVARPVQRGRQLHRGWATAPTG